MTRPPLSNAPRRPADAPTAPSAGRSRRSAPRPRTALERYRGRLLLGAGALAVIVVVGLAYLSATSPAYACASQWTPSPTPTTAPGATPRLGYVQDDLGRTHVQPGSVVKYALCPPASGGHVNITGEGPIKPGVYGPDDQATPEGWIHNLEHGGLVLLYKCPGDTCTDAGQAALKALYAQWPASPVCKTPPGVVGPIFARFDQMAFPYAVLVWGEVLPLQTFDTATILAFWQQQGERTNPERLCPAPTATPGAS